MSFRLLLLPLLSLGMNGKRFLPPIPIRESASRSSASSPFSLLSLVCHRLPFVLMPCFLITLLRLATDRDNDRPADDEKEKVFDPVQAAG